MIRRGLVKDYSGTVITGGTSQQACPQENNRSSIFFQNVSDITLWFNFGAPATAGAGSYQVPAGGYWENPMDYCPVDSINVLGATTGKGFTLKTGTG